MWRTFDCLLLFNSFETNKSHCFQFIFLSVEIHPARPTQQCLWPISISTNHVSTSVVPGLLANVALETTWPQSKHFWTAANWKPWLRFWPLFRLPYDCLRRRNVVFVGNFNDQRMVQQWIGWKLPPLAAQTGIGLKNNIVLLTKAQFITRLMKRTHPIEKKRRMKFVLFSFRTNLELYSMAQWFYSIQAIHSVLSTKNCSLQSIWFFPTKPMELKRANLMFCCFVKKKKIEFVFLFYCLAKFLQVLFVDYICLPNNWRNETTTRRCNRFSNFATIRAQRPQIWSAHDPKETIWW